MTEPVDKTVTLVFRDDGILHVEGDGPWPEWMTIGMRLQVTPLPESETKQKKTPREWARPWVSFLNLFPHKKEELERDFRLAMKQAKYDGELVESRLVRAQAFREAIYECGLWISNEESEIQKKGSATARKIRDAIVAKLDQTGRW